jgi:4,5-DOPA dioxygenase extradiol
MLTRASLPETIHDFSGPPELFGMQYPAPGNPDLAQEAVRRLQAAGFKTASLLDRGFDHGAWVPLMLMYPDADIPLVQLSVQTELDPRHHLELGRALRELRNEGIFILGSGGAVHNLDEIHGKKMDSPPPDYVLAFDTWLEKAVAEGDEFALLRYKTAAPLADRCHPYPAEHFLPLFVPMGAAGKKAKGRLLHRSFMYGALSMAAYIWE